MVLAAAGAEHQELLRIVEPMLATAPAGEKPVPPPSTYVGGEVRLPTADPMAHVILAFDSLVSSMEGFGLHCSLWSLVHVAAAAEEHP